LKQQDQNQNTSILFEVIIPGRVGIKKNGKQIVMRGLYPKLISSPRYLAWADKAKDYYKQAYVHAMPIAEKLHAEYTFHFKNHQAEPDVSNCIEGPQDLLEACGVIHNDKQIISLTARKVFDGTEKTTLRLTMATEA